jgi:phosphoribosylglycinamide formyltransferase-1
MSEAKIGVMVSGHSRGTNFQAILDAVARGDLHAKVALLVATNEHHGAVARARDAHIRTLILPPDSCETPEDWDHHAADALYEEGVSVLCLAGYLRRVTRVLLDAFPHRILNIHPALLPSFGGKGMYGLRVHRAVLEHGCKVTGCTVHLLDEYYDTGPIVAQACVPVEDGDTPESLSSRVQMQEHRLFPQCIEWLVHDRLRIEARRVKVLKAEKTKG